MKFKESTKVTKTQQNAAQRKKNFLCFSKKRSKTPSTKCLIRKNIVRDRIVETA